MRPNKIRKLLEAGKPTIGTHLHSSWPSVVEIVGHTGLFDYVEFTAEYVPYDLRDLDNFCRAAELYDMSSVIKVDQEPRSFLAQRAIGSGFQSVLFADVRTVEDARECVRAVRPETPDARGSFGSAMRRFSYVGSAGEPEYVKALNDVVVVLMIEKKPAVDHLEEILSIGGIDMVTFGVSDYSMSIGKSWNDPEVQATELKVIDTCLQMGVAPRSAVGTLDGAKRYLDLGVRHFCIGVDIMILYGWLMKNGEGLRRAMEGA